MFDRSRPVLAVDIGNVISYTDTDTDTDIPRGERRAFRQMEGAFEGVRELRIRFEGQVALVSKCGGVTQVRTREWLSRSLFFEITGVSPNHVFFCEERRGKAPICDYLGVTHAVDDRLEVLSYLRSVKYKYLFAGQQKEMVQFAQHLPLVVEVSDWQKLLKLCHP